MRILQVVHKFLPGSVGGTEVYSFQVSKALARQHDVVVFCREHNASPGPYREWDETYEGLPVHRFSEGLAGWKDNPYKVFLSTFTSPSVERGFAGFLSRWRPHVVHIQHLMGMSARLAQVASARGIPVVMTLHDYWLMCSNSQLVKPSAETCQGTKRGLSCVDCARTRLSPRLLTVGRPLIALLFAYRQRVVSTIAKHVQLFICPSNYLRRRYVDYGLPDSKLLYLENGINAEAIAKWPKRTSDEVRFAYLGSIAWQKGIHVLCRAFDASLPSQCTLKLYGDLNVFPEYAGATQAAVVNPNLRFMGPVEHAEVGRALAETDVLVVPSLWYENSPVVIQEAFAARVPVLASDIGALAEKVRDGVDGLLFRAGDADHLREKMILLARDSGLRRQLTDGVKPPQTIECSARALEQCYAGLIGRTENRLGPI